MYCIYSGPWMLTNAYIHTVCSSGVTINPKHMWCLQALGVSVDHILAASVQHHKALLMPHAKIQLGLQVPVLSNTESNCDKRNTSQQLFAMQNWQAAAE
jgi:hypothetical protein